MRAPAALLLVLLAAGCGRSGVVSEDRGVTANQILRVSTPKAVPDEPPPSVRIEPLRNDDPIGGALGSGLCSFSRGRQIFLIAAPRGTVARVGGQLLHLVNSAPYDDRGGFFENRRIGISVGRGWQERDAAGTWPARMMVTNRRNHAQAELYGNWTCLVGRREP